MIGLDWKKSRENLDNSIFKLILKKLKRQDANTNDPLTTRWLQDRKR